MGTSAVKMTTEEKSERLRKLKMMQSIPLSIKVQMSLRRIEQALRFHDRPYVAFSGGADSMVLSLLVQTVKPDVLHVFNNTSLEEPEVLRRIKEWPCAEMVWTKPLMPPVDVWRRYGYPMWGKDVAEMIGYAQRGGEASRRHVYRRFSQHAWAMDCGLKIDAKCCDCLKKKPAVHLEEERGLDLCFLGIRTDESRLRMFRWVRYGCDEDMKTRADVSRPLSFWKRDDVEAYLTFQGLDVPQYRTGCVVCGFGAHIERPNHFQRLRQSNPARWHRAMYDWGFMHACLVLGVPTQ